METRFKELYDAPSAMILEVELEGVICNSGEQDATRQDYENDTW